ncbi:DUF1620-domain-containing protein [Hesseltinella vesiculosa]|uniref:ER membrane protein complex subunit 1 n=1 Tax=Hesseltinella vesiculosa TaxID=101127 RepID=A0A1X2GKL2_9FUNG|nr:DUF1620-domain-containing protein [Hesseltinella vesiculosa]
MKHLLCICILLCISLFSVSALYESQAGVIDWLQTWIGKPQWMSEYQRDDQSHLLVFTERHVLASLSTATGALEWRQVLESDIASPQKTEHGLLTVSKTGDALIRFWDFHSGRLLWQRTFEGNSLGVKNGIHVLDDGQRAIVIFESGAALLHLTVGEVEWISNEGLPSDGSSHLEFYQLDGYIYAVCTNKKTSSLSITSWNLSTGQLQQKLTSLSSNPVENARIQGQWLVWTETDSLKWKRLDKSKVYSTSIKSIASFQNPVFDKITVLSAGHDNRLILSVPVSMSSGENVVDALSLVLLSLDEKTVQVQKELGLWSAKGAVTYALEKEEEEEELLLHVGIQSPDDVTLHVFGDDKNEQRRLPFADIELMGGIDLAYKCNDNDIIIWVASSGSIYAYDVRSSRSLWSREEALAHTQDAVWLDLPEKQSWTQVDEEDDSKAGTVALSRYIRRLTTHVLALPDLPAWVVNHFVGMGSSSSSSAVSKETLLEAQACWSNDNVNTMEVLHRDSFGLRKLIVSATSTGKIIAQDTGRHGKIVWTRHMPGVNLERVFVVRVPTSAKLAPVIVVLGTSRFALGEPAATHLYRLDGWTGKDFEPKHTLQPDFFEPEMVTDISIDKVMLLPVEEPEEHTHLLALYDKGSTRTYIYPDTALARQAAQPLWPSFYFQQPRLDKNELRGFQVKEGYRGSLTAEPVWSWSLPADEQLVTMTHPLHGDKVASLGRVLGNRNVFYKYLNPNLLTVASLNPQQQSLTIRLVDAVKGSVLYDTVHHHVPVSAASSIHVTQTENFVVYTFWSNDGPHTGYQIVVLDLYEGAEENQRSDSANFTSFDSLTPHIQSASFAFPHSVQSIGITRTKNGVSTKDILFATKSHQIVAINKRFLDPRRPQGKPTKEDQEEQLFPYGPIPDERKMFLTYDLDIFGIRAIIASPSSLESTSLIHAYGLDSYFTRDAPSRQFDVLSETFSKSQLLLTIVALVIGVLMTGPVVRRKQVNALWK